MIRPVVFLLVAFSLVTTAFAQQGDSYDNSLKGVPLKERIVVGGGLGASFGSQQDFFSISPMIGYKVTERLLAGSGVTYRYTKYKFYSPAIKLNDYGFNPFVRYNVFNGIFAQVEYEYLNYEFPVTVEQSIRKAYNSFLAGGGFIQPIGDKAAFYILALYNFSYQDVQPGEYSPYASPLVLRGGITLGF